MDRQRLLTIFGAAWVSAALLTWFLYARTTAPKTEKMVRIVAAARELPAGTKLGKGDVKLISVAERDLPRGAVTNSNDLLGRALLFPAGMNEPITESRMSRLSGAEGLPATIEPGMRAVSVPFTDSSGVSGLLQPRAHVDVLYTRTGTLPEAMTVTLLEDVVVLSIGRVTEVQTQPAGATKTGTATAARSQNQTATLMVTPDQAKKLELAKNQGRISLALRNPLDRSTQGDAGPATIESIDPMLLARSGRRGRAAAELKDSKAWAKLIGEDMAQPKPKEEKKEPPKPRHTVDVYRGEKHVQEIFQ